MEKKFVNYVKKSFKRTFLLFSFLIIVVASSFFGQITSQKIKFEISTPSSDEYYYQLLNTSLNFSMNSNTGNYWVAEKYTFPKFIRYLEESLSSEKINNTIYSGRRINEQVYFLEVYANESNSDEELIKKIYNSISFSIKRTRKDLVYQINYNKKLNDYKFAEDKKLNDYKFAEDTAGEKLTKIINDSFFKKMLEMTTPEVKKIIDLMEKVYIRGEKINKTDDIIKVTSPYDYIIAEILEKDKIEIAKVRVVQSKTSNYIFFLIALLLYFFSMMCIYLHDKLLNKKIFNK